MEQEFRYDLFEPEQFNKSQKIEMTQGNSRSMVSLPDQYMVLAIVVTGDNPEADFLLEVSAQEYNHGRTGRSYTELVRPESYYLLSREELERTDEYCIVDGGPVYYIKKAMVKKTGITNQMLCQAKEQQEVLQELYHFIGDYVLVGYEMAGQLDFLNQLLVKQGLPPFTNTYVDCKSIAVNFGKRTKQVTLNELAILYGIAYEGPERADKIGSLIHQVYKELHPERISLENKVCVFTGTLQHMVRGQAMQLVRRCGGMVGTSVTKRTDYLILGSKEYQARLRGEKSTKLRKAERMIQDGLTIQIISEEVFYDMAGYHATSLT